MTLYNDLNPPSFYFGTPEEKIRDETLTLFKLFLQGLSVRKIAQKNNIAFETLRDRFTKYIGNDYRYYSGSEGGLTVIINEYKTKLQPPELKIFEQWIEDNKEVILLKNYELRKSKQKLYSNKGISNIEKNQHYYEDDLRDCFFLSN